MRFGRLITASSLCALLAAVVPAALMSQSGDSAPGQTFRYHPKRRVPPSLESVQRHLVPGSDAFPDEKEAEEIAVRLARLSESLRERRDRSLDVMDDLLAHEFKGGALI